MKNSVIFSFLLSFFLISCGDDSSSSADDLNEESEKRINTTISGMAQGPFEEGSTVSVYELDTNFQKTGYNIETEIINEHGEYSINVKNFQSQYVLLKADGKLHDIFTSEKTSGKTTLYALADLGNTKKANINILTHLAHKRALYLVTQKNMTVAKAQKQAEKEVLKSFSINDDLGAAEDIDIFTDTKQNWPILSISALMQSDLLNRGVKDFLADYVSDIEKDGTWDDKKTITKIADWAYERSKKSWSDFEYKISTDTSAIKKHMNKFWQQNYGLENCTSKQNNVVKKNNNPASNEANTFFICKSPNWIIANKDEVMKYLYTDTLHIDSIANDGELYWDMKYSVCYVYEDSVWFKINKTNCTLGLSECTKLRKNDAEQDSNNQWYICDGKEWISMNDYETIKKKGLQFEKDIQNWKDTTEGAIRKGDITDIIYIYDNKKWRVATLPEASLGMCSEKTENLFGYAEERKMQDLVEPRVNECIERTHSSECGDPTYHQGYYICRKNGQNNFYWERLDAHYYDRICNDSSYYASSKEGDAHWGSVEPIKKKCINCKQENFDYLENICKERCYVHDGANQSDFGMLQISGWRMGDALECALGFGGCTESRFGTIKEGPVIKTETGYDYLENEHYISYSYVRSIDSTQKRTYVCWYTHNGSPLKWYDTAVLDNDFYYDIYPAECTYDFEGQIIAGKKNKYVCEDEKLRIATQEEIEEGIACTEYNMYDLEKCGSELEKQTGMTCAEYMRHVEKCRTKLKE